MEIVNHLHSSLLLYLLLLLRRVSCIVVEVIWYTLLTYYSSYNPLIGWIWFWLSMIRQICCCCLGNHGLLYSSCCIVILNSRSSSVRTIILCSSACVLVMRERLIFLVLSLYLWMHVSSMNLSLGHRKSSLVISQPHSLNCRQYFHVLSNCISRLTIKHKIYNKLTLMVRVTYERAYVRLIEGEFPVSGAKSKKLAVINSITDLEVLGSTSFDVTLSLNCWMKEHLWPQVAEF